MVFLFSGLGYFVYTFWNSNSDDSISDKINHHDDSYFNQKGSFFLSATDIILRETPSIKGKIVDVVRNSDQEVYILSEKDATNPGEAILLQETVVHSNGKRLVLTKGKALQVLFKRGAKTKVEVNTSDFGLISAYLDNSVIKSIANEKWIKIRVKSTGESGWILKQFVYSRE